MSFLDRALRMGEAKKFKSYEQRVSRINAYEAEFEHDTDAELRETAEALSERARNGEHESEERDGPPARYGSGLRSPPSACGSDPRRQHACATSRTASSASSRSAWRSPARRA